MTQAGNGWSHLVGVAMLTNPAAVLGVIAPAIITGLTLEVHLPLASAATLVAVQFTAMTVGILVMPLLLGRSSDRALASIAIGAALFGQLAALTGKMSVMVAGQALLGFAEGALFGLAIANLAQTSRPDRAFGVSVFLNQATSALLLTVATIAHARFPSFGIFGLLIAFLLLVAAFVPAMSPERRTREGSRSFEFGSLSRMLPPLAAILLFAAAFGTVWPLVASVARGRGVADGEIGRMLSLAGLIGIAGAGCAILLADRAGRVIPLLLGSACFAVALAGGVTGQVALAAPAILFFWSFLAPYYLGAAAAADPQGRLAVLAGAMIPLGIAAGQMLAGVLFDASTPERLGLSAGAVVIVAILCTMLALRQARVVPGTAAAVG